LGDISENKFNVELLENEYLELLKENDLSNESVNLDDTDGIY